MSQSTVLKIEGMTCGHCKASVEKALKAVPGVVDATVDLAKKEVSVIGSSDRKELVTAIEDAGYTVVE